MRGVIQELEGKRVVVSGGAGGIGLAAAHRFLQGGALVHLVDIDRERLEHAMQVLAPHGEVSMAVSDMATPADCHSALAKAGRPLHALVHMAGWFEHDPLDDNHAVWDRAMASNLTNAYDACIAFRALRDKAAVTRIVLATSRAFQRGAPGRAAYAAAKGGIVGLVRSFSREFAPDVLVNAVSPGLIRTRMSEELVARAGAQRLVEIPLGRFGTADDVAGPIVFLCSAASAYITGQTITVDGGVLNG